MDILRRLLARSQPPPPESDPVRDLALALGWREPEPLAEFFKMQIANRDRLLEVIAGLGESHWTAEQIAAYAIRTCREELGRSGGRRL